MTFLRDYISRKFNFPEILYRIDYNYIKLNIPKLKILKEYAVKNKNILDILIIK